MEMKDLLALVNAGYTKAEIAALTAVNDQQKEQKTEPQKEPQKEPKTEPQTETQKEQQPDMAALLAEVQKLRADVQAANIQNSKQPEPKSIDDILAASLQEN